MEWRRNKILTYRKSDLDGTCHLATVHGSHYGPGEPVYFKMKMEAYLAAQHEIRYNGIRMRTNYGGIQT